MMVNPVSASKEHIIVYDPDFKPLPRVFQLNELYCLIDEKTDGLHATFEGKQHAVIVRVPASLMEKGGKYRFVIFAWDNHAHLYKDRREKPALEINSPAVLLPPIVYISDTYQGVCWHGAWCWLPLKVTKTTKHLSPQTVISWIEKLIPEGSGLVGAGVNGGFFNINTGDIIGHVGTGTGWHGNDMLIKRWNFGMRPVGTDWGVGRMQLKENTKATYTLHPAVRSYPFGFSGIGVLIMGRRRKNFG